AEQDWEAHAPALRLDYVQVGVAEPAGNHANEHFARARGIDRQLFDSGRRVRLRVDDAACRHVARRSCSSRDVSGSPKVSTALGSMTTLSPSWRIVSWSRVTGAPGRRSVRAA